MLLLHICAAPTCTSRSVASRAWLYQRSCLGCFGGRASRRLLDAVSAEDLAQREIDRLELRLARGDAGRFLYPAGVRRELLLYPLADFQGDLRARVVLPEHER